ncbi:MAG: hypothetical protein SP1CHLAM54_05860 [Chlamydiia bacterium]|nr:hypothetical protein [Chlamydiia bacterium]MCH9615496.1 hypothetical protein [Chlamydiia bacterium]MCH9629151.1 hypothetical protein [Chlamydiia bacterium]
MAIFGLDASTVQLKITEHDKSGCVINKLLQLESEFFKEKTKDGARRFLEALKEFRSATDLTGDQDFKQMSQLAVDVAIRVLGFDEAYKLYFT